MSLVPVQQEILEAHGNRFPLKGLHLRGNRLGRSLDSDNLASHHPKANLVRQIAYQLHVLDNVRRDTELLIEFLIRNPLETGSA